MYTQHTTRYGSMVCTQSTAADGDKWRASRTSGDEQRTLNQPPAVGHGRVEVTGIEFVNNPNARKERARGRQRESASKGHRET